MTLFFQKNYQNLQIYMLMMPFRAHIELMHQLVILQSLFHHLQGSNYRLKLMR